MFIGISEFCIWLSIQGREFNYLDEWEEKLKGYFNEFDEPHDVLRLYNRLVDVPEFKSSLMSTIFLMYRQSNEHREMILKNSFNVFQDPILSKITEESFVGKQKRIEELESKINSLQSEVRDLETQKKELTKKKSEDIETLRDSLESEIKEYNSSKSNYFEKISEVDAMRERMESLILEKAQVLIEEKLPQELEKIKKENQEHLLNEVFSTPTSSLSKSDIFEKEEAERERRKKEEELDRREFKAEVRDTVFEQDKSIVEVKAEFHEYKHAHKSEHAEERLSNQLNFNNLANDMEKFRAETDVKFISSEANSNKRFTQLEAGVQVLKSYIDSVNTTVNARIDKEMSAVTVTIGELKANIKESFLQVEKEFASRDVEFKEQILNLNHNQMKVVSHLETMQQQTEVFKSQMQNEMQQVIIDVDRKGVSFEKTRMYAENLLQRTENLYSGIKNDHNKVQLEMDKSLNKLESGKDSMFLELSKQKLVLEKAAQDVYHTAKEVAYGKMDIELLYNEKQQRVQQAEHGLNMTKREIAMKEKEMKSFWSNESMRNKYENQVAFLREKSMAQQGNLQRQVEQHRFVANQLRQKRLAQ